MNWVNLKNGKSIFAQASVLKRLFAFIIDLLIINLTILYPLKRIFERIIPDTGSFSGIIKNLSQNSELTALITGVMLFVSLLTILYFMILEKNLNQTPGKILFNLYVKSQTKDLKYWQLFVRSMFMIPFFPFVLLWIIDPIVMLFNKDNQRLSEILSKTKVVEKYKI